MQLKSCSVKCKLLHTKCNQASYSYYIYLFKPISLKIFMHNYSNGDITINKCHPGIFIAHSKRFIIHMSNRYKNKKILSAQPN